MNQQICFTKRQWRRQTGVTLVELMVSLAIGLVIALAVTMAYVAVRGAATSTEAMSRINEDGKLALNMIAREIQMAGTYPAAFTDPDTPMIRGAYVNTKGTGNVAYDQGIFGCSGVRFLPATGVCDTTATADPDRDSIVLNYFSISSQADVGTSNTSVSTDCLGQALSNDTSAGNNARFAAIPKQPMFVSNRFAINATSYSQASTGGAGSGSLKSVSTGSLSCNGNGINPDGNTYQPIFEGVTQMVIRYAVSDGATDTPQRFYTATEVSALAATAEGKTGWQRVSAVRVCLLMQSLTGGRNEKTNESTSGKEKKYTDCHGVLVPQAVSDRNIYKAFTRVIAARNNLTGVQ